MKLNFLFILSLIGHCFSEPVDFNFEGAIPPPQTLMVSLGSGCDTGMMLRDNQLRHAAFPFDWLISNHHSSLISMLDQDFEFFADVRCFSPLIDTKASDHNNPLQHTHYKELLFFHEEPVRYDWNDQDKFREQLDRVSKKYTKRINRFRDLRSFSGKVYFIRNFLSNAEQAFWHPELAVELRDALRRYFPTLDFILVIVTYLDVNATPILFVDQVEEFRMDRRNWKEGYKSMFKTLLNPKHSI